MGDTHNERQLKEEENNILPVIFQMENVLLDERGHLKLTDYGLSRHLPQGARAYTICGTLQYMGEREANTGRYTLGWRIVKGCQ